MIYVLRECGEWPRAAELAERADGAGPGRLGRRGADRHDPRAPGKFRSARRLLGASPRGRHAGRPLPHERGQHGGLACVAAAQGADDDAAALAARCSSAGSAARTTTTRVAGLRWAAGYFARRGDREGAHACAEALARIACDDRPRGRARRARLRDRRDRARRRRRRRRPRSSSAAPSSCTGTSTSRSSGRRSRCAPGVALAAAGEREAAARAPAAAHRSARKLGARPLAAEAAREVAALGGRWSGAWAPRGRGRRGRRPVAPRARGRAAGRTPGAPTARSRRSCSSARAPSTCTCATCCASSTAARASRPRAGRASSACSSSPSGLPLLGEHVDEPAAVLAQLADRRREAPLALGGQPQVHDAPVGARRARARGARPPRTGRRGR